MIVLPPPMSSGMTKFDMAGTNTKMHPVSAPGSESGSVTVRNARHGPAPRFVAASRSDGSSCCSEAYRGSTMSGRYM